ncbi:hypothetical protein N9K23_00960, partial [Planktomarina temperata]|nr:hypothetical protein [Planktomarina temperata]
LFATSWRLIGRRGGFLPLSATTRRRPTARRFLRDLKRPCPDASSTVRAVQWSCRGGLAELSCPIR